LRLFKEGAYLYTLARELSEAEFIKRAGGVEKLEPYKKYPLVTLVLDDPDKPLLVGHNWSRAVALVLQDHGHDQWQTMQWRDSE